MWKSKKYQHVGHSAAEDEYMAMAHAARAVNFMRSQRKSKKLPGKPKNYKVPHQHDA